MPFRGSPSAARRGSARNRRDHHELWLARWQERHFDEFETRRSPFRPPRWAAVWIPVLISLFVQVPSVFFVSGATRRVVLADRPIEETLLALGLALIGPVALIFARRFPGPVVAIVAVAASVDLLAAANTDGAPYISFAFAIGSAIVRGARVWAWATIAISWVGTIVLSQTLGLAWQPWRIVGISFGILIVIGMAEGVRTSRERRAEFARIVAGRRASEVQAERVRIARELHDVLAHSLSQINVQAGVGLHLIDKQPEKAAEALASIKLSSKTALDEVRSVLGILRAEGGADPSAPLVPEPDLSRLDGLVASVTSQGVGVTLHNGIVAAPGAIQLAIYRIVQESLTNVARHAHATAATVTLGESDTGYTIAVVDNGRGHGEGRDSGGRGLLGMRERAELLGGTLDAAAAPGGGFAVRAHIPRKDAA